MKIVLLFFLSLLISEVALATKISPHSSFQKKSVSFEFYVPEPFSLLKVEFLLQKGKHPSTLSALKIDIGSDQFEIGADKFGKNFRPITEEMILNYLTREKIDGSLTSFWLVIPYGKKEYIDCGFEGCLLYTSPSPRD